MKNESSEYHNKECHSVFLNTEQNDDITYHLSHCSMMRLHCIIHLVSIINSMYSQRSQLAIICYCSVELLVFGYVCSNRKNSVRTCKLTRSIFVLVGSFFVENLVKNLHLSIFDLNNCQTARKQPDQHTLKNDSTRSIKSSGANFNNIIKVQN